MILHILKKDLRRLWAPTALTLVLLAALAHEDRWRMDWVPGLNEGWLNLLLPLAWVVLIAMVIHEEALGDDRQFWITRPYSRGKLLAEKALFLLLCIHAPVLLADALILAGRSFSPIRFLPQLLGKQVVLAGLVVAPAAAIASLTRKLPTFLLVAIGFPAAVLLVNSSLRPAFFRLPDQDTRHGLTIAILGLAALLVLLLRYLGREALLARVVAVGGGLASAAMFLFIPPVFTACVRSAIVHRPAPVSIRLDPARAPDPSLQRTSIPFPNTIQVALPIAVDGIPPGRSSSIQCLALDIIGSSGDRYSAPSPSVYRPYETPPLRAQFWPFWNSDARPVWLVLALDRTVFARLETADARVSGKAVVSIYRDGETTWMPIGVTQAVAGVGRCTSLETEDNRGGGLKVVCESPAEIVSLPTVRLVSGEDGREWRSRIGGFGTFASGPREAWLSPVNRRQTFFRLTDEQPTMPGSQWLVPRSALASAKIGVTPYVEFQYAGTSIEFHDLMLGKFVRP